MSTRRKPTPSYLLHKQSGRARAVWTDTTGTRQQKLLPGAFDSPESRTAFARLQLELEAAPHRPPGDRVTSVSVNEVLLAYLDHAERHYRGRTATRPTSSTSTSSSPGTSANCTATRRGSRVRPAGAEGRPAEVHRSRVVPRDSSTSGSGGSAAIFKWAVAEELVPPAVHQALAAVAGLQRGRTDGPRDANPSAGR